MICSKKNETNINSLDMCLLMIGGNLFVGAVDYIAEESVDR